MISYITLHDFTFSYTSVHLNSLYMEADWNTVCEDAWDKVMI